MSVSIIHLPCSHLDCLQDRRSDRHWTAGLSHQTQTIHRGKDSNSTSWVVKASSALISSSDLSQAALQSRHISPPKGQLSSSFWRTWWSQSYTGHFWNWLQNPDWQELHAVIKDAELWINIASVLWISHILLLSWRLFFKMSLKAYCFGFWLNLFFQWNIM